MAPTTYPSVIERYYKKFYDKRDDRPSEDVCVLIHSNKVCVVTLCPDHKALQNGPIQSLNYVVEIGGKKVADVHGKRKLQAIKTRSGLPLCEITSGDGTIYTIKCPVRGKLCELNDKMLKDLTLLHKMPETNGYLAIILHHSCDEKDVCSYLLTEEQYLNGEVIQAKKVENVANGGDDEDNEEPMNEEKGASDAKELGENKKVDTQDTKDEKAEEDEAKKKKIEKTEEDEGKDKVKQDETTNTEETEAEEEVNKKTKRRGTRSKKTPAKKAKK